MFPSLLALWVSAEFGCLLFAVYIYSLSFSCLHGLSLFCLSLQSICPQLGGSPSSLSFKRRKKENEKRKERKGKGRHVWREKKEKGHLNRLYILYYNITPVDC